MGKTPIFSQKVAWQCHIFVKKVYPHQNVVKLCSIDPKRQPVKVKYFFYFCFFVLSPISFILIVIETHMRFPLPSTGLYFIKKNQFVHKISNMAL
jgi:hypothetical protein